MAKIGVGLIGSGFVTSIHLEAFRSVPNAEVRAVASSTEAHVKQFAAKHGLAKWFTDYRKLLDERDVQLVVVGVPNYLHCEVVCAAAAAGKHVVLEKPMARNLAECDQMIAACKTAGVKL